MTSPTLSIGSRTTEPVRRRAAEMLITRPSSAAALLRAIDAGQFPAALLTVEQVRPIAQFKDEALDALVKKHWGSVRGPTPEEKLADVRRLNNDLRAASGDVAAGRVLFQKNCGICHKLYD